MLRVKYNMANVQLLYCATVIYCLFDVSALPSQQRLVKRSTLKLPNPTEVAYIISGADEFGGQQTKQFEGTIIELIEQTLKRLEWNAINVN